MREESPGFPGFLEFERPSGTSYRRQEPSPDAILSKNGQNLTKKRLLKARGTDGLSSTQVLLRGAGALGPRRGGSVAAWRASAQRVSVGDSSAGCFFYIVLGATGLSRWDGVVSVIIRSAA